MKKALIVLIAATLFTPQQIDAKGKGACKVFKQACSNKKISPSIRLSDPRVFTPKTGTLKGSLQRAITLQPKVRKQMKQRGWSEQEIFDVINKPFHTSATTLKGGEPGTAYFRSDFHYVTRNNNSGNVWTISDRRKPISLKPTPNHFHIDDRITTPPSGLRK